jgi:hypothetical protein
MILAVHLTLYNLCKRYINMKYPNSDIHPQNPLNDLTQVRISSLAESPSTSKAEIIMWLIRIIISMFHSLISIHFVCKSDKPIIITATDIKTILNSKFTAITTT